MWHIVNDFWSSVQVQTTKNLHVPSVLTESLCNIRSEPHVQDVWHNVDGCMCRTCKQVIHKGHGAPFFIPIKSTTSMGRRCTDCRLRRRKSLAQEMEFQGLRRSVAGIYLLRTLIKWNQYAWLWGIVGDNCHAGASSAVCCTGYLLRLGTSLDMPCKHESKYATKYCKYRLVLKSMKSGILHEATCTLDSSVEVLQRCFGGYTRIKEISVSDMLCCSHCVNRYLNPTCYTLNCDGKGMCGLTYNSCCDTCLGP